MESADYLELEKLVQRIQKGLAPKADVLHNVRLQGRNSGVMRQIDVLVQERIGQFDIKIVIDCKAKKRPVDVKGVEEFYGLIDDVAANKGVLVSPSGFTNSAKTRASKLEIDLYSPFDTDAHKWQVNPLIGAVCDFRIASISFGIRVSSPVPFRIFPDFFSKCEVYSSAGDKLGTCYKKIVARWNNGEFVDLIGRSDEINVFGDEVALADNGYGVMCPVEPFFGISVSSQLYHGHLPIPKISGFKDELEGSIITNAFTVGILDPDEIIEKWTVVEDLKALAPKPAIILQGIVGWDENAQVEFEM
jgi:hypothetical protein